jgi:secondary thiamine-phosphate synthase enzyme
MAWLQRELRLRARPRGFHLLTEEIVRQLPELREMEVGLAYLFLQHTSAALALNENADPTVRGDMARYFDRLAPDNAPYFEHTSEGPDDMPAHLKAVLLGSSLSLPIRHGRLALGTWQGIYLCEFRDQGGERRLLVTLHGE